MKKQFLLSIALCAGLALTALPSQAEAPKSSKDTCLTCHGPLETFLKKEVHYNTDGQTINPHRFVPHDSQKPEDFPDCTNCHKPHTLPPPKGFKDTKVEVSICYECHHNYKFQACSSCHK